MKLSDIKSVKVGILRYKVCLNKHLDEDLWGEVYYSKLQIRIQKNQANKKIKKKRILITLLHEIIHAIDMNVIFTKDRKYKENNTDLLALYIVENIEKLVNKSLDFNHFKEYISKCEMDINRKEMIFEAMVKMLSDNKKLVKALMEVLNDKVM